MSPSERELEAEAVWRELERSHGRRDAIDGVWRNGTWEHRPGPHEVIARVIAALDRVRDARSDEEGKCSNCGKFPEQCWLPPHLCKHPARSPQGEDHEETNDERRP